MKQCLYMLWWAVSMHVVTSGWALSISDAADMDSSQQNLRRVKRASKKDTMKTGATFEEKQAFVNLHNAFRTNLDPTPANMKRLTWSPELALWARQWAAGCYWGHGQPSGEITGVGQNLWTSTGAYDEEKALQTWYDEYKYYNYNTLECSKSPCGHYTQMVWANTKEVGCAIHFCPTLDNFADNAYYVVCNYRPAGNVIGQKMYQSGPACSACPDGFPICDSDGLCSAEKPCGDMMCDNGVQMWNDTCVCEVEDTGAAGTLYLHQYTALFSVLLTMLPYMMLEQ